MNKLKKTIFDYSIRYEKMLKQATSEFEACFSDFKQIVSDDIKNDKKIEMDCISAKANVLYEIISNNNLTDEYKSYIESLQNTKSSL